MFTLCLTEASGLEVQLGSEGVHTRFSVTALWCCAPVIQHLKAETRRLFKASLDYIVSSRLQREALSKKNNEPSHDGTHP